MKKKASHLLLQEVFYYDYSYWNISHYLVDDFKYKQHDWQYNEINIQYEDISCVKFKPIAKILATMRTKTVFFLNFCNIELIKKNEALFTVVK